ncbi:MAG: AAA family ATPase [Verrucomicrobia bacterium]|nr:AAA family ATPase [Verrucomicrobiota bacterium]
MPSIFIAATAQHVGKTTLCLGILSGLFKRFEKVGFIKPIGQRHVEVSEGQHVDKDAVLFRERFNLDIPYSDMSPVLVPTGFTRDYLDGKIEYTLLKQRICESFERVRRQHHFTVVEGTGHAGVGSIIDLNNADVAAALGLEVVLVSTGGLGSAFDQLALNWELLKSRGVKVRGIILNKVLPEKIPMVLEYIPKALKKWDVPLLGCIPYSELLQAPTMRDYELLFGVSLIAGEMHRYRHFLNERFVATTAQQGLHSAKRSELIITHSSRDDIIHATIEDELRSREERSEGDLERGMILTGHIPPSHAMIEAIKRAQIPVLYVPLSSYKALQMIAGFTAKIRREDICKVEKAIHLVEEHIQFELLCHG